MRVNLGNFLFICCLTLSFGQEDLCNPPCVNGECNEEGTCSCIATWGGEDCSIHYSTTLGSSFVVYHGVYAALFLLMSLVCITFTIVSITKGVKVEISQKIAVGLIAVGSLGVGIFHIVNIFIVRDPSDGMTVFPLFYSTTVLGAYALQIVLWAELHNSIRREKPLNVRRARLIFLTSTAFLAVFSLLPLLPTDTTVLEYLYYGLAAVATLTLSLGFLIYGCATLKIINEATAQNASKKIARKKARFKRITYFIGAGAILWIVATLVLVLTVVTRASEDPDGWLVRSIIMRFFEIVTAALIVCNYGMILWHDNQKTSNSSSTERINTTPNVNIATNVENKRPEGDA